MISRDDILSIAAELDPTAGKGIGKNFIFKPDDVVELVRRALSTKAEPAAQQEAALPAHEPTDDQILPILGDLREGEISAETAIYELRALFATPPAAPLSDEEIAEIWKAQRTYHGGEPCKMGHLAFAKDLLSRSIAAPVPEGAQSDAAVPSELLDLAWWHGAQACNLPDHATLPKQKHARTAEILRSIHRAALASPPVAPAVRELTDEWQQAVIEQCVITEAVSCTGDPRKVVRELIHWHVMMDRSFSAEAKEAPTVPENGWTDWPDGSGVGGYYWTKESDNAPIRLVHICNATHHAIELWECPGIGREYVNHVTERRYKGLSAAPQIAAAPVAPLSEERIDFIARQYFAEPSDQENVKNAIHDAFQYAGVTNRTK